MKLKKLIWIIVIVAILTAIFTYFLYSKFLILEVKDLPTDVNVTSINKVGFNLDKDRIHFGTISNGGNSKRQIDLHNTKLVRVEVRLIGIGDIKEFLYFEPQKIVLSPGETVNVSITAIVPPNTPYGGYEGYIRVQTRLKII